MPFKTSQCGMGDWMGKHDAVFWNRTGATLKRGQVAMVDLLDTQAEVTHADFIEGDELSVWASTTPVTTTAFENGHPVVVALEDIADNARGKFRLWGKVEVATIDDDGGGATNLAAGDRISMIQGESQVAVQGFVTGGTGSRTLGLALETAAANSSDTDRLIDATTHLRWCFWTGGMPLLGSTDT